MPEERSTAGWKHIKKDECPHIGDLKDVNSDEKVCAVCGEETDLRMCLTCGVVNCCESHNSHNTEHFKETDHPFIRPHNSDYNFLWCYKCNAFLD